MDDRKVCLCVPQPEGNLLFAKAPSRDLTFLPISGDGPH